MGSSTVIVINNDRLNEIEKNPNYFFDRIRKGMSSAVDNDKNYYGEDGITVFHSVYRGREGHSQIYFFDGHRLIEMDADSEYIKRRSVGEVKTAIEQARRHIKRLEEALLGEAPSADSPESEEYPKISANEEGTFEEF